MFHLSTVDPETFALLQQAFKFPFIKKQFALAGGTAMALQVGHRKSIDLDFFSEKSFLPSDIEILLREELKENYEPLGKGERMLFSLINKIKCDFVHEPFPVISSLIEEEGIKLYSLQDIAIMKMHTLCGRGKKKDFFDIYVFLHLFQWQEMLGWFEKKYGQSQLFFLWKSIQYFADADEDVNIHGMGQYDVTWEEVKKKISTTCKL